MRICEMAAVVGLMGASLCLVGVAAAQPESRTREQAREEFSLGSQSFSAGNFEAALRHFRRAYEIEPLPVMLYNIGNAHDRLGDLEEAVELYKRYLEEVPKRTMPIS